MTNLNDSGPGSLRQAILDSNATPGADTITFSVTGTITLTTGELLITDSLTITGPGATALVVSGNDASRVLHITEAIVSISDLTIRDGNAGTASGGGIFNDLGHLTITNTIVAENTAGGGGGISSFGTTNVISSALLNNTAFSGGGTQNFGGTLTLTNSTVSGNFALSGGGINSVFGNTPAIITNSTIVNNAGGGIEYNNLRIKNSIVANSATGPNCTPVGTVVTEGVNFSTDSSCPGFTQVTPAQLNLAPAGNNGGPTPTHALLPGSVAIDAVTDCTDLSAPPAPVTTDQRGFPRPQDGDGDGVSRCDAGAYEAPALTLFDQCIEDDSNGNILNFNSSTGAYQFTNCSGFTLEGTGKLVVKGGILTLQDNRADRRVLVRIDSRVNRGTASIQILGQETFTITDRNTLNNLCACTTR